MKELTIPAPAGPMDVFFAPKTVALIGATENPGSVGRTLLWNLISNPFGGIVFPVNPKRKNVLGIKAYSHINEISEGVELAIIATPASTVLGVVKDCVAAGVKGAIIVSAGFKETGLAGIALEQEILKVARLGKMRLIGPNCLGLMSPRTGLNASFASGMAKLGKVGFLSQSGALCSAILDWSFRENWGFSAFISLGSMLDVGWGDLIYHLGDDPNTNSIIIYMESIGNARSFLSAAREVALSKPIIVIKAGRTEAAALAAASHTGSLTGSDEVLDAAFRRCGVLRVNSVNELFSMAELLAKQPRPRGQKLTIITNAGGPGVLATDALIMGKGKLAKLSEETVSKLNQCLPVHWSHGNPIDILGDAPPERYGQAVGIAAADPETEGILVILSPQDMTDPTRCAQELSLISKEIQGKPLLASWMGGSAVASGEAILNQSNVFNFPYPDTAAQLFNLMWQYSYNLRLIYETPENDCPLEIDRSLVSSIISSARDEGRTLLTEWESKRILHAYGLPTVPTEIATTPESAVELARSIGYPVVLKLHSYTITHKSDVGGVRLNLHDDTEVIKAYQAIQAAVPGADFLGVTVQPMMMVEGYELILGSSIDPQFGPVLLFGTGGTLVEVFKDRALGLPPLNTTLALRMMQQTKIYQALKGVRGKASVNLAELELLMVRFSQLVVEQRGILEIDINPLVASNKGFTALDARIVLCDSSVQEEDLVPLAIRPYPYQYVDSWQMQDGTKVLFRPIRPEDEPLIVKFHQIVSQESFYRRYFDVMKLQTRTSHERLTRICFIDYDQEIALVAISPEDEILGVGRLVKLHHIKEGEFGLLVSDLHQGRGLGRELLLRLLQIGKQEGLLCIRGQVLLDNRPMQSLCNKLGFTLVRDGDLMIVSKSLTPNP